MENIIPYSSDSIIFDIKGSSIGRYVESFDAYPTPGIVLKDENFKKFSQRVILDSEFRSEIIKTLEDDMNILMKLNIMDYSILLAFYEEGHKIEQTNSKHLLQYKEKMYAIGIIDIFQAYNRAKISERVIKKVLFHKSLKISVQSADAYYSRLCSFLQVIFVSKM